MTPHEKAMELMSKFVGISLSQVNELVDGIRLRLAKESALIAVEEILNLYWNDVNGFVYWNEVKSEIEKL